MPQDRCTDNDFSVFLARWNATQNYKTPGIHFQIAIWLQKCWELGKTRLILQAFRASGKSTIAALFSAWLLCRDPDLRILVLSAELHLARKMVRTIRKILENHPLTKNLRPNNPDQWASDSFTVNRKRISRDPSVSARGIYANTTGSRADIIICDDVEVPNTCDTAEKRQKLRERLTENEFILVPGGTQIYIGTPHTYYTLYANKPRAEIGEVEPFLKEYEHFILPILKEDGSSAWPERYHDVDIVRMRRMSGPAKFSSQMMLEPVNVTDGKLNPDLLRKYNAEIQYQEIQQNMVLQLNGRKLLSASAWWDPSFGKTMGDASVLAVVFTDEEGDYYLHNLTYITVKPKVNEDEATLQCKIVAEIAKKFYLPNIAIETNGLGKFLPSILRRVLGEEKIPCAVVEKCNVKAKSERILEAFDVVMAARALHVHEDVYQTRFIKEMQEWKPSAKGGHDDGLDAVAGALSLEPVRLKRQYNNFGKLWTGVGHGHTANTQFDV